ncbi:MAG: CocE/NonD family hydrolase [Firmicutes bacterium]|nr:CocE/NonD family hydrolase [Bacillota bacterium]
MKTRTESVPVCGGASLATSITLPSPGAHPVVIVRTVYGRRNLQGIGDMFGSHGYATVIQDVRGSGESSGQFGFLAQEPKDAVETAQWVLDQPWCDGRLAILGISYLSAASIAIAAGFPDQVKAAVWVTVPVKRDLLCFQDGALRLHHTLPWMYMRKASLGGFDPGLLYRTMPLLDAIPQSVDPSWASMLEEGPRSKFWDGNDLWDYVRRTRVPGLHFGGWFDFLADATLVPYSEMVRSGAPQRLVLGPWSHNGTIGGPEKISGDVSYGYWPRQREGGPDGLRNDPVDMSSPFIEECLRWLDFWVKGTGDSPARSSVKCFFTGHSPHWAELQAWPHPGASGVRMYLGAQADARSSGPDCQSTADGPSAIDDLSVTHGQSAADGRSKGVLSVLSADATSGTNPVAACESFVYDPDDPVPTEGGAVWAFPKAGLVPGPMVSSAHLREDVLTYDSEVLGSPLEICGAAEIELYASSDAPDTDFVTMLLDVDEDGVARYVSDGIVRARYRNGLDKEDLLEPGQIYLFRIRMKGCAHTFGPGHRVRLTVTSSNFPKFDRNPNTGEPIYRSERMQKAVQTVYHGPVCPSAVVLPVLSGCQVRPLDDDDREWAERLLKESWGSPIIATRGRLVDASRSPGFVAVAGSGDRLGLLTYEVHSGECEIVTLNSLKRGVGIGQRLIRKVVEYAKEAGASRVWLITTNDNTDALKFYQKAGFRIAAVHRDAIVLARRIKPEIPFNGENGIPIRDEIELELRLDMDDGNV